VLSIERARTTLGEEFSFFLDLLGEQVRRLDLAPGARVLDVGTGQGRAAITLALCGFRVVTGEPADDHSAYAKQAWQHSASKVGAAAAITHEPFDAAAMPFDDASFDGVFMMGSLHHIDAPAAALRECLRVLRPGGALCIMEPTARLIARARLRHPDHPDPTDPTPLLEELSPQPLPLETLRGEMFDTYVVRR
jgi:ubiquinone/menaquinone biosynthesis C-methylase UbiE